MFSNTKVNCFNSHYIDKFIFIFARKNGVKMRLLNENNSNNNGKLKIHKVKGIIYPFDMEKRRENSII